MSYQTELHCHSMPVSACGRILPEDLVELYLAAGYHTVVLTNHFSRITFSAPAAEGATEWKDKVQFFLSDHLKMKAAAQGRLHVLLGMEFRLDCHEETDLLVYGLGEAFLLKNSDILQLDLKEFSARIKSAGGLLIQAHPFRDNVVISDPALIDGVEAWNCSSRHASRNDVAEFWADRFSMIKTSGSDLHRSYQTIGGGIVTSAPITSNEELLVALRTGAYQLIRGGEPAPN